jgi:hypothetical protein
VWDVHTAISVTITAPSNNSVVAAGSNVNCSATASDSDHWVQGGNSGNEADTIASYTWTATLVIGAVATFQVAFGRVRIITGNSLKDSLGLVHWALSGIASAAAGAWLAAAVLRSQPWARLATDAAIVAAIIAITGWAGWFTERQPSGFPYHPTSHSTRNTARGISAGVEPPIKDGEIVLLMKGKAVGVLIPTKHTLTPERISYDWYHRTDGGSKFRPEDEGRCQFGHTRNAKNVSFGPFWVWWSGHNVDVTSK